MRKIHFNLIFIFLILTLIFLFFYSGWNYSENMTETMVWKSGKFKITEKTKLIGIILILSFPAYYVLRKKVFHKIEFGKSKRN